MPNCTSTIKPSTIGAAFSIIMHVSALSCKLKKVIRVVSSIIYGNPVTKNTLPIEQLPRHSHLEMINKENYTVNKMRMMEF